MWTVRIYDETPHVVTHKETRRTLLAVFARRLQELGELAWTRFPATNRRLTIGNQAGGRQLNG